MKFHLKCVVAGTKFTFEKFTTILTQIKACLNSRPLTALSCDSDSVEVLTPGHFWETNGILARHISLISCTPTAPSLAFVSVCCSTFLAEMVGRVYRQPPVSEKVATPNEKFSCWRYCCTARGQPCSYKMAYRSSNGSSHWQ